MTLLVFISGCSDLSVLQTDGQIATVFDAGMAISAAPDGGPPGIIDGGSREVADAGYTGFLPEPATCDADTDFAATVYASAAQVAEERTRLIQEVWGQPRLPTTLPEVIPADPTVRVGVNGYITFFYDGGYIDHLESWRSPMADGHASITYRMAPVPSTRNGKAVLIVDGHGTDRNYIALHLLALGYDILYVEMPGWDPNEYPDGSYHAHDHIGATVTDINPLRLFLEPSVVAVNELVEEGYSDISIVGLSGGGWTATVVSALDTRILRAFPVAGSSPRCFWDAAMGLPDYEQIHPLWNYPALFYMSAYGRRTRVFYNDPDRAFNPEGRELMFEKFGADINRALGGEGRFTVLIENHRFGHMYTPQVFSKIGYELDSVIKN